MSDAPMVKLSVLDRVLVAVAGAFALGALAGFGFAHSQGTILGPWRGLAREIAHSLVDAGWVPKT